MASEPVCVEDFEPYLKKAVPNSWWEYYKMGANSEQTLKDNRLAFRRYRLRPRCLRDVSTIDTTSSILGHRLDFPVGVAPTACHGIVHPEGEVATAKGAASVGTAMAISMWANRSLEDVAASVPPETPLFQQLDFVCHGMTRDRLFERTVSVVTRAEKAGCKAIVATVDQPARGWCLPYVRHPAAEPPHITYPQYLVPGSSYKPYDLEPDPSLTWSDIKRLRSLTSLPVILKGVLTAEDAKKAVRIGAAGILVSNHGGRQLDGVPATIDALPDVVKAVRGSNVEVYLDGGIRTGTDVLKALALGARAVFIGRPAIWGLAYDGEAGVRRVLQIIREEFSTAMALTGCSSLSEITSDLIATPPYCKL